MIRYIEIAEFTEHFDGAIPKVRTQEKVSIGLVIGSCLQGILVFTLLFEETGNVGQALAMSVALPAIFGFGGVMSKSFLKWNLNRAKTISLLEDFVEVKNWNGELRQRLSYKDFQYIEVLHLYKPFHVAGYHGGGSVKVQVICLYTGTSRVREGHYSEYYSGNKEIIMFPYDAEAWEALLQHIPQEKVKPLEECTPFEKVKWI